MKAHRLFPAPFVLFSGAILKFVPDCGSGFGSDIPYLALRQKYSGQRAEFVEYASHYVGPLDNRGLLPGAYRDYETMRVKFSDGQTHLVASSDVAVLPGLWARHVGNYDEAENHERVGNLPQQIKFWPGDQVVVRSEQRSIRGILFAPDGKPRYFAVLSEQSFRDREEDEEEIKLISRGNVWALYHNSEQMAFVNSEEELKFWAQDGISYCLPGRNPNEELFDGDLLYAGKTRRLHECFAHQRARVAKLMFRIPGRATYLSKELDLPSHVA